ncbi:hypothetical protein AK88_00317 [Plasmodium fragile]|uniref:Uncharacterized protein n=1 Tax=Plasmodium fragile TaxID=5857 RepID=A0A0D9QT71_PLAFR|nr:uncharacterized protein AK88_00317 [Plasmodium fragile]KJP90148.1 hypothetical protein AK88_00317 [Plasmodium fragile]
MEIAHFKRDNISYLLIHGFVCENCATEKIISLKNSINITEKNDNDYDVYVWRTWKRDNMRKNISPAQELLALVLIQKCVN